MDYWKQKRNWYGRKQLVPKKTITAHEYFEMVLAQNQPVPHNFDYSRDTKIRMAAEAINRPDIAERIISGERIIAKDNRWWFKSTFENIQPTRIIGKQRRRQSVRRQAIQNLQSVQHCAYCNIRFSSNRKVHIDHVYPISRGGPDCLSNLVKACHDCNLSKGSKTWYPIKGTIFADGSVEIRIGGGKFSNAETTRVG